MAKRPIFVPAPDLSEFVKVIPLGLTWHQGFAVAQKKKNIHALHDAAARAGYSPVLEISTKSDSDLGQHLSAFHLKVGSGETQIPLESAYQGSKVFERGGPFTDLYAVEARTAKREPRLQNAGKIVAFDYRGVRFPTEPKTIFYDWLYINAIFEHREWLRSRLTTFAGFSDIEFNPERSLNCQARSCALFVALMTSGLLELAVESPQGFIELFRSRVATRSDLQDDTRRLF